MYDFSGWGSRVVFPETIELDVGVSHASGLSRAAMMQPERRRILIQKGL